MKKFIVNSSSLIVIVFLLTINNYQLPITSAQTTNCGGGNPPRVQVGLVTTPSLSGKFSTTGACVTDPKVTFIPFKIPTYANLKSTFYDQSKLTKNVISGNGFPATFAGNGIYQTTGDLTINSSAQGSGTEVIFVEGKLNINNNIIYHSSDGGGGLVFVVSSDIIIDSAVTQIDAVLISSGYIYTAGANCTTSSVQTAAALTLNGSIISLNPDLPPRLCRTLNNNTSPAELINHQVKYLVILKDIFSENTQKWAEIP